jgi:hypothetical protein
MIYLLIRLQQHTTGNNVRSILTMTLLVAVIVVGVSCSSDTPASPSVTGQLVRYDSVGYYGKGRVQAVVDSVLDVFLTNGTMAASEFRGQLAGAQQGVRLYKIAYTSVVPEMNNKAVTAYGLVAIPDNVQPGAPILSYQHGTVWSHEWSPSNPDGSIETQFVISQFASQGYIVISADYFGVTPGSDLPNSYCVKNSTVQACSDMLKASKVFLQQKNITPGKLFLHGWSQGGYSTDVFLKHLQEQNAPVAAVVTASGPSDPYTFVKKLATETPITEAPYAVGIISSIVVAFDAYKLSEGYARAAIKPEYYDAAVKFHALEMGYQEFFSKIPLRFDSLYTQQFLDDAQAGTEPFWRALKEADGCSFQVRCPYRAYYSNVDEYIFAEVSRKLADYQKNFAGSNAEAIDAGPKADHRSVYLVSLINAKPWFDSLK